MSKEGGWCSSGNSELIGGTEVEFHEPVGEVAMMIFGFDRDHLPDRLELANSLLSRLKVEDPNRPAVIVNVFDLNGRPYALRLAVTSYTDDGRGFGPHGGFFFEGILRGGLAHAHRGHVVRGRMDYSDDERLRFPFGEVVILVPRYSDGKVDCPSCGGRPDDYSLSTCFCEDTGRVTVEKAIVYCGYSNMNMERLQSI